MGCFSGPDIPVPQPPPEFVIPPFPPMGGFHMEFPEPFDPEAAETKRRRADELKQLRLIEQKRKGYASTILTGGRGLEDEPMLRRPTLRGE
jgi:hypothetical protein